ncbi:MAG: bifunctional oligoribonuclease/PAP phosphatase NrnA [Bacillati bacterium ANGP1]|uniref:Bifunctional oligoribonuclease/PAP phosphatase NrnA n=1 Tax=Candidatus Segetimicrobium genomatis TaxID=2569760 RepID=A0A537IQZ1_9BACT|nr:MAG: bifunctional oligoribonuclease/PAP phosphatase NrnA [Terrabacteria group bacterium ANGP1]
MTDLPYQIAAVLRKSRNVLIACHVAPDGDCLGSALGLRLALARIGVDAQVGSADGVPDAFLRLPGAADVMSAPPATRAEVAVAVECSMPDRAGSFAQALADAKTLINIDHHLSNAGYGHLVYWDTAAATGEQMADVIAALRVPIDREIAECLLTAVVTDTGSFRHRNTTARSLRLAADLVDAGASVHAIVERVYETRSAGGLRLLGMALASLTLGADGRIVWTTVPPEMLISAGAQPEEVTGIVGMLRQIRGVQVALLFEVTPQGVRVGIRSRDGARSHVIAEAFGGGGHQEAAGFTATGPLDKVIAATLAEAEKELRQAGRTSAPFRP